MVVFGCSGVYGAVDAKHWWVSKAIGVWPVRGVQAGAVSAGSRPVYARSEIAQAKLLRHVDAARISGVAGSFAVAEVRQEGPEAPRTLSLFHGRRIW